MFELLRKLFEKEDYCSVCNQNKFGAKSLLIPYTFLCISCLANYCKTYQPKYPLELVHWPACVWCGKRSANLYFAESSVGLHTSCLNLLFQEISPTAIEVSLFLVKT